MAKVENLEALVSKLSARAAKSRKDDGASVIVGYTAAYALYVHENLQAVHPVGQAKFLEQPARTLAKELGDLVNRTVRAGRPLTEGLLIAGLRLQRESQQLVPVDTGALKGSAFTRLEEK